MRLVTLNINSGWHRKKTLVQQYIDDTTPEIIALQETRKANIHIDGYDTYRKQATDSTRGVALLVKSTLTHTELDLSGYTKNGTELIGASVRLRNNKRLHVIGTYIHGGQIDTNTLSELSRLNKNTVLIGDYNAKLDVPLHLVQNHNGKRLQDCIDSGQIIAAVPGTYTRIRPHLTVGNNSCIDFALTNPGNPDLIQEVHVGPDVGSDHLPVLFETKSTAIIKTRTKTPKPNIDKADWVAYQDYITNKISNTDITIEDNQNSIDNAVDFITTTIQEADRIAIPRKIIPNRGSVPLPRYIIDIIKRRRRLLKIAKKTHLPDDLRRQAKSAANNLQKQIEQEMTDFKRQQLDKKWEDTIDKTQYGFWKLAQALIGTKQTDKRTCPLKDANGQLIEDDDDKSEAFRQYYETVFRPGELDPRHQQTHDDANALVKQLKTKYSRIRHQDAEFDFGLNVTPQDIIKVLRKTKHTAPGTDGIYYTHIKNLPDRALEFLSAIYEITLRCAYFPKRWKQGQTILLNKPGKDLSSTKSYRPITLLSALGKTMERIINIRLKQHLETHNLLPESQAGFRSGRSTQDQLFKLTQEVIRGFQVGLSTVATFFDIEKAFDKLWIEGLVLKLKNHIKLKEGTIALLLNFLTDRSVSFKVGDAISAPLSLTAGTPQGSILSPTLFNLGVSDIPQPEGQRTSLSQFADDIATWSSSRDAWRAEDALQNYNNAICDWCLKWKIKLAPSKTQLIHFKRKHPRMDRDLRQTIDGTTISESKTVKFLGITFDRKMELTQHNQEITKRIQKRVNALIKITGTAKHPRASPNLGLTIHKSMVVSLTGYAPTIQVLQKEHHAEAQDKAIRRGARLALHVDSQISSQYIHDQTKIDRTKARTLQLARKYLNNPRRSPSFQHLINTHRQLIVNRKRLRRHVTPLYLIDHQD